MFSLLGFTSDGLAAYFGLEPVDFIPRVPPMPNKPLKNMVWAKDFSKASSALSAVLLCLKEDMIH